MKFDRRILITGLAAAMWLSLAAAPSHADRKRRDRDRGDDHIDDDRDHEAAARARAAGKIVPLTEIIKHVNSVHPGDIVGIELERDHGRWMYEIKLITPQSRYLEIYVDARDKRILKIEGD